MASKSFACCIAETLPRLCRHLVQASSLLECTSIKSLILLYEKNKRYQTADSSPAGATAEVTTKHSQKYSPSIFSTAQMTNRDY